LREIKIDCGDRENVLQIKQLKWKFRGNESVDIDSALEWFSVEENEFVVLVGFPLLVYALKTMNCIFSISTNKKYKEKSSNSRIQILLKFFN
jgi:hypothetical protein